MLFTDDDNEDETAGPAVSGQDWLKQHAVV